jgi:hypothetical protein
MKKIRLSKANDKRYDGHFEYLIAHNYNAGLPNRYDVFIMNADDPVTIGLELKLVTVRNLIKDYEAEASKRLANKHWSYIGDHATVLSVKSQVIANRIRNATY